MSIEKDFSHHTRKQTLSDIVAQKVGSMGFIYIQAIVILIWILWNILPFTPKFDERPFILLNLLLSFQAAFTAPLIMMSQNRQAEIDRRNAHADYIINKIAKKEIEQIQEDIRKLQIDLAEANKRK